MVTDRPTASLTGQEDWEWNERREGGSPSYGISGSRRGRDAPRDRRRGEHDREAALRREIRELEAELERTERRLQCVIERYERLLAEKNRRLNERGDPDEGDDGSVSYLSTVFRWSGD